MAFGVWWVMSFAAPAVLALLMPRVRSLALCTLVSVVAITVALRRFGQNLTEATDGPETAFAMLLFWTGYAGVAFGAFVRLLTLTFRARNGAPY